MERIYQNCDFLELTVASGNLSFGHFVAQGQRSLFCLIVGMKSLRYLINQELHWAQFSPVWCCFQNLGKNVGGSLHQSRASGDVSSSQNIIILRDMTGKINMSGLLFDIWTWGNQHRFNRS